MSEDLPLPVENRISGMTEEGAASAQRKLKSFRYVVGSVNQNALKVWTELWQELQQGVAPNGVVLPAAERAFKPSCGWPEFLEKLWLLKHYLDYVHNFVK
jgi:hypothetical protein